LVQDYPGEPVPEETFTHLCGAPAWCYMPSSGLMVQLQGEDNRGRCTASSAGCHPILTIGAQLPLSPSFLHRMPFLSQPFQFNLIWDRHQVCQLANSVAWSCGSLVLLASQFDAICNHCCNLLFFVFCLSITHTNFKLVVVW